MSLNSLVPRSWPYLIVAGLLSSLTACGGDATGPEPLDLDLVSGAYALAEARFDPQGSAPAADIHATFEAAGSTPTLNIGRTGRFQLFYRDPLTGNVVTAEGDVHARVDGVQLRFDQAAGAEGFVLPQTLELDWDEASRSWSFSGAAEVGRARLLELFPDLYGDEQLFDPTPGTLTVRFVSSP